MSTTPAEEPEEGPGRASIKQAVLERINRLKRTSPAKALANRRESDLIINTMFRTLAGRYPTADERTALSGRSLEGASFDQIAREVATTEAAVDRLIERIRPALHSRLRWDHERSGDGDDAFSSERVVFLHIMKTGGLALNQVCSEYPGAQGRSWAGLYIDDLFLHPRAVIARLKFISGHFPHQTLEIVPGPFRSATVLREPFARTISHFSELRRTEPSYADVTLEDFVTRGFSASGNYQARQLAHRIDLEGAWATYDPYERLQALGGAQTGLPLASLFDTTPLESDENSLLETATRNLAEIDFVGVTEDMSTVGTAIADVFGGTFTGIPRFHVSPPFDFTQLNDRVRKMLEARTSVDRELYDQARRRAEAQAQTSPRQRSPQGSD